MWPRQRTPGEGLPTDDYHKTTEDDLRLLSALVLDTLDGISGGAAEPRVYECPDDVWDECEAQCFVMTGALALRAKDEWYVLYADWFD